MGSDERWVQFEDEEEVGGCGGGVVQIGRSVGGKTKKVSGNHHEDREISRRSRTINDNKKKIDTQWVNKRGCG